MPQAKISVFFQPSQSKTLDSFQFPKEIEASDRLSDDIDDYSPVSFAFQDSKSDAKCDFKGKRSGSSSSTSERNLNKKTLDSFLFPKEIEALDMLSEDIDDYAPVSFAFQDSKSYTKSHFKSKMSGGSSSTSERNISKKRCYEQYHLDLGQSDFVLHTCLVCGLMYACGVEDDEKIHRKFHQDYYRGIRIKGWHSKRVVSGPWSNGDHILLILDSDQATQKRAVQNVVKAMQKELGFVDDHFIHVQCKVYLFISGHRIVGCLVAEPIQTAHRVISSSSSGISSGSSNSNTEIVTTKMKLSSTDSKSAREATLQFGDFNFHREFAKKDCSTTSTKLNKWDSGAIICEEQAVPAKCGIKAIWVVPSRRRKRIASQLMDAARKSFFTSQMLEISECAYSPPTSAGMAFASGYTNSRSFLVYRADDV